MVDTEDESGWVGIREIYERRSRCWVCEVEREELGSRERTIRIGMGDKCTTTYRGQITFINSYKHRFLLTDYLQRYVTPL